MSVGPQADPPQRPVLFVNPRSGGGKAARAGLAEHARDRGIEVTVLQRGDELGQLVAAAVARGADTLGVAGGDGSLAIVAAAALEHGLPFVCLPAGTRNHFARDVGVAPNDLVGALDAFGAALERTIDLCDVNGTARITASPPNRTPTTATERSVTRGDSPTVLPMWGLTT